MIEYRFFGSSKEYVRDLCRDLSQTFGIKQNARRGHPAHMTLYGGFSTSDESEMVNRFLKVCKGCELPRYTLSGFDHIGNRVIQLDVKPSDELRQLRLNLAKELNPICSTREWDVDRNDFIFHTTLANHVERQFDRLWSYVRGLEKPKISEYVLRVTLLKHGRIYSEYDLLQRRRLNRNEALNHRNFLEDVRLI